MRANVPERPSYYDMISAIGAELEEIEAQLEKYTELHRRRERLRTALAALEAVAASKGSDSQVLRRAVVAQHAIQNGDAQQPSLAEAAFLVLKEAGSPLHIREIISRMQSRGMHAGREYESVRGSLAGALDSRVDRRDLFTKPEPGTYGLLEWGHPELPLDSAEGMSISEAIGQTVLREPGLRSRDVADRILPVVRTSSDDPRKVISTIVGQLVNSRRLLRDDHGRLFPGPRAAVG